MENLFIGNGWIILTKSTCIYCEKVKRLLDDLNRSYLTIDCDEYLKKSITKTSFLDLIKMKVGFEYKTFPMVFYNQQFIGGFNETQIYLMSNLYLGEDF